MFTHFEFRHLPILICFLYSLVSCQTIKNINKLPDHSFHEPIKQLVENKLGVNVQYLYNDDSTFIACYTSSKASASEPFPIIHYLLVDSSSQEILLDDEAEGLRLEWLNTYQLKIWYPSRTADAERTFIYDVRYQTFIRK